MKILNIGSLNLDYFYTVDHITQVGETQNSQNVDIFAGGKGLNQSISLANTGLDVYHAGFIGKGGDILLDACKKSNINTKYLKSTDVNAGTAVIQVDSKGNNCIVLFGGSNQVLTKEFIDETLNDFSQDDFLILQNEVNMIDYIIEKAYEKQIKIVFNPSPFDDKILKCDLKKVWLFLINEVEGEQISGKSEPLEILKFMSENYENSQVVLTLGGNGSYYSCKNQIVKQEVIKTDVVDTTAAGDTFTGYFIYALTNNYSMQNSLKLASTASSITITRKGASATIPKIDEVLEKYKNL